MAMCIIMLHSAADVYHGTSPDTWAGIDIARERWDGMRCPRRGHATGQALAAWVALAHTAKTSCRGS